MYITNHYYYYTESSKEEDMYSFKVHRDCDISEACTRLTLTVAQIVHWHQYTVPCASTCNTYLLLH